MTASDLKPWLDGLLEGALLVSEGAGRILAANAEACRLLGEVAASSLVGQPVTDWMASPEDMVFWSSQDPAADAGLWSQSVVRRPDGQLLPVERRVGRVCLGQGQAVFLVALLDRSREQQVGQELELLIAELRATLDSSADGLLVCNLRGDVRAYNRRFAQIWNVPEVLQTQRDDARLHEHLASSVLDRPRYEARLLALDELHEGAATDMLALRNGRILERVCVAQLSRGRAVGRVFSFRDITEQRAAEAGLRLAGQVFESSLDAVFIASVDETLVAANPACERLVQAPLQALLGRRAASLFLDVHEGALMERVRAQWGREGFWQGEVQLRREDGSACPVQLSWVQVRDGHRGPAQSVGFLRDLTEQHEARRRIEQLAYSDVLTGLPNRLLLAQRVDFTLKAARRQATAFAILFLDLDRFKNINDSLGHQFGDRVLIQVAERIRVCLRDVDILCRLGGDEFVLYLHGVEAQGAERVAARVLQELTRPFVQDAMSFSIGCSIGVALYPHDGDTLDELIKQADTAMYEVKAEGRGRYKFYQPQMNVDVLSRMKLETAMRRSLEDRCFELHYQPQLDLATGRMVGAEALIRWNDAERGLVSPAHFIPLAEESGLIVAMGAWVMETAVRQARTWYDGGLPLPVSVNVSALQFRQTDFVAWVGELLTRIGLPAHCLELELTESILVQGADEVLQRLRDLASLGVRLAIDDFGTGYSSLAYLKRFPIHRLKIDQSFVRGLPDDDSDRAIVTAMINMAGALGLEVVAEGVESEAQRHLLQGLGCEFYQGFLFSPALPATDFDRLLRVHQAGS
ncbi:MAG: EAL domain-containing protein [Curvibacter sp.]|nr:EAL domain-containing protein [Curvibacter sp.]